MFFQLLYFQEEISLKLLSYEDFIFPHRLRDFPSFDLCPVQKHGQVEETSFLKGKALFLIIHDFIEKATLGKGLILSGGMSWEANIHTGEVEFSPFAQVFQWPKRRKIHMLN